MECSAPHRPQGRDLEIRRRPALFLMSFKASSVYSKHCLYIGKNNTGHLSPLTFAAAGTTVTVDCQQRVDHNKWELPKVTSGRCHQDFSSQRLSAYISSFFWQPKILSLHLSVAWQGMYAVNAVWTVSTPQHTTGPTLSFSISFLLCVTKVTL